jgi:hypothetical protein
MYALSVARRATGRHSAAHSRAGAVQRGRLRVLDKVIAAANRHGVRMIFRSLTSTVVGGLGRTGGFRGSSRTSSG